MRLFASKLDPFCSFTINLGPLYAERIFDRCLTLEGVANIVRMPARERYERYLDRLKLQIPKSRRTQYAFIQFYLGHFCHQLANHSPERANALHFREKALCYYQSFLEIATNNDESRYYAQWQTGMLQDALHYPWSQSESSLLKANLIDPLRGEGMKKITQHYIQNREWPTAFIYSTKSMNQFCGKHPAATRRWFIDFDAYNWNVLHAHFDICHSMGNYKEAEATYSKLLVYKSFHRDEFKSIEIRQLRDLEKRTKLARAMEQCLTNII